MFAEAVAKVAEGIAQASSQGPSDQHHFMSQNDQDKGSSGSKSSQPETKPIKVGNMEKFFATKFGKEIKDFVEKTSKVQQGQAVYRVTENIPKYGLKKGDQFYLDNMHKDHLEVFRKNNTFKTVINIDGTENFDKAVIARGRRL